MLDFINTTRLLSAVILGFSLLPIYISSAGPGHDHGPEEADIQPEATVSAPRLVAHSEQFEVVGILEEAGLHLYLDDYASNTPVGNATLELEIDGEIILAEAEDVGIYHAALAEPLGEGVHPVMITVLTEQSSDLLIGELDVHVEQAVAEHPEEKPHLDSQYMPWLLTILAVFLLLILLTLRRDRKQQGESA